MEDLMNLQEELNRKELEVEKLRDQIHRHPCFLKAMEEEQGNPSNEMLINDKSKDSACCSTPEQCKIEIIYPGQINSSYPCDDAIVKIHYTIALKSDPENVIEDSRERRKKSWCTPFEFVLGRQQVIPGWETVVRQMTKGDVGRVTIPSESAYGEEGLTPSIPPNSDLICRIELIDFNKAKIPLQKLIIDTNPNKSQ